VGGIEVDDGCIQDQSPVVHEMRLLQFRGASTSACPMLETTMRWRTDGTLSVQYTVDISSPEERGRDVASAMST
jgi:hypothetical protein